jgi:hypothetical protein
MAEIYITSRELIKTLRITDQELMNVETFFDSISDDEWELIEGKDYKVVNRTNGLREYSLPGAYTIARYLEANQKQNFWQQIKEWFLRTKREIHQNFVRKKILDNCSSLIKRNNQFFISRADVITIFGTRSDYLTKMAECAKRTQYPLIKGTDYEDFVDENEQYFSLSGIYKLAQVFEEHQSKKNRKEWCKDVGETIAAQVENIVTEIKNREERIASAKKRVKTRDNQTCRVTLQRANRVNGLQLAAHHLYSRNEYPHLADIENNLITLTGEVHRQFHQEHMGGTNKPCTIDDFVSFVQKYHPSRTEVIIWLEQQKLVLGEQKPVNSRKPHVLYLPLSRVKG